MTDKLSQIRERCDKALEGPWFATTRRGSWDWLVACEPNPNLEICQMFHDGTAANERGEANSQFIAHARTDIPYLLDRVAELETQLAHEKTRHGIGGDIFEAGRNQLILEQTRELKHLERIDVLESKLAAAEELARQSQGWDKTLAKIDGFIAQATMRVDKSVSLNAHEANLLRQYLNSIDIRAALSTFREAK